MSNPSRTTSPSASAFSDAASLYDADSASNLMMRWLRRESLRHLVRHFGQGDTVLEIGCGTGEEAMALARRGANILATDASPGMISIIDDKLRANAMLAARITARVLPAEHLASLLDEYAPSTFDGAYSSLGPLNCTPDLLPVAQTLSALIKPGGKLVISMLNKYCLWEIAWYLAARKPGLAFRRWNGHAQGTALPGGPTMTVYYWPLVRIENTFKPYFRIISRSALPWALPPTYAALFLQRSPRLFATLNRLERQTAGLWPFYKLGDHVLVEMERSRVRV